MTANARQEHGTFQLFEHDTSQQFLTIGDPATGVGDQFVFGGDVSNHKGGAKVGRMAGACTNTSATESLCAAAFTIGGGQITFQGIVDNGTFSSGQPTDFAITGGTGPYRHAHGTITGMILQGVPNSTDAVFTVQLD